MTNFQTRGRKRLEYIKLGIFNRTKERSGGEGNNNLDKKIQNEKKNVSPHTYILKLRLKSKKNEKICASKSHQK